VVLSDQHFPANITVDITGECMRILRIENRILTELADDLLKIKLKEGILKGSVILYGSNAYLGVVSAECYVAECAKTGTGPRRDWGMFYD
jgi:hypothetical protein